MGWGVEGRFALVLWPLPLPLLRNVQKSPSWAQGTPGMGGVQGQRQGQAHVLCPPGYSYLSASQVDKGSGPGLVRTRVRLFESSPPPPPSSPQAKSPAKGCRSWILQHKYFLGINNLSIYLVPSSPWVVLKCFHLD